MFTLIEVLRCLGLDAKDNLVACLQRDGGLKSARLCCQALRQAVDDSIHSICLTVGTQDKDLLDSGVLLPLHRWPRCNNVSVQLRDDVYHHYGRLVAGDMLLLPFAGLPLGARQHITRLWLPARPYFGDEATLPGAPLALLVRYFPALRRVCIGHEFHDDHPSGQLLLDALSGQPHLEELRVPPCRALERVDCLAESLRHLTIYGPYGSPRLSTAMAGGIARLYRLQSLSVGLGCGDGPFLRELLRAAPAELQLLELPNCEFLNAADASLCDAVLHLVKGRVVSLLAPGCLLSSLARFAAEVLLPSGAVAPRLQRLCLQPAFLHMEDDVDKQWGTLEGAHADGLRELLRRCDAPEVGSLSASVNTPPLHVVQALQMLDMDLSLHLHSATSWMRSDERISLSLHASPDREAAQCFGMAPHKAPAEPSLLELMIRRFALDPAMLPSAHAAASPAGAVGAPAAPAEPKGAGAPQAMQSGDGERPTVAAAAALTASGAVCASDGNREGGGNRGSAGASTSSSDGGGGGERSSAVSMDPSALLFRGPLLAGVVRDKEAVNIWIRGLVRAAEAQGETLTTDFYTHVALPSATAVLVRFYNLRMDAAVAAFKREAAEIARDAGGSADEASDASDGLQVLRLAAVPPTGLRGMPDRLRDTPEFTFVAAWSLIMQEVLDGKGFAGGWSAAQRLGWVLQQWAEVRELQEYWL